MNIKVTKVENGYIIHQEPNAMRDGFAYPYETLVAANLTSLFKIIRELDKKSENRKMKNEPR